MLLFCANALLFRIKINTILIAIDTIITLLGRSSGIPNLDYTKYLMVRRTSSSLLKTKLGTTSSGHEELYWESFIGFPIENKDW
jgi:hypothetical protein